MKIGGSFYEAGNVKALLPIGVFLVLYLGLGILFEYGLQIPMGFYNIPIVVAFLVALLVACLQNPFEAWTTSCYSWGRALGDKNIVTMILIFLVAGIFVGGWWAEQRGQRGLFSPLPGPRPVCCGGSLCGQLLCGPGHGYVGGHHHPHYPHCRLSVCRLRFSPFPLYGLGSGRGHVWATTCPLSLTPPLPPVTARAALDKVRVRISPLLFRRPSSLLS